MRKARGLRREVEVVFTIVNSPYSPACVAGKYVRSYGFLTRIKQTSTVDFSVHSLHDAESERRAVGQSSDK
jgi:hypothetical protein